MSSRDCNDCSNILRRDGTSQKQRFFEEQATDYVKVDERSYIDLIQFAISYAGKIQFWDILNNRSGDWVGFMKNSQASIYSEIASLNLTLMLETFDVHFNSQYTSPAIARQALTAMMNQVIAPIKNLDNWLTNLDDELELKDDLRNSVERQAARIVKDLIAFDKGAYIKIAGPTTPNGFSTYSATDYSLLSDSWELGVIVNIAANEDPFTGGTVELKVNAAKGEVRFLFLGLLDVLKKLQENAEIKFNELLTDYSKHEPHFGLFLAFIQLFKYAQDHVNEFTDKHLDFYYRDVLRLKEKAAQPDSVHLIFEPAKNIEQKKVEKGTPLKAGKDTTGIAIEFKTDDELVINKAKIAKLQTLYLDRDKDTKYIQTMYKSDIANSSDGFGKEFIGDEIAWEPFGKTQVKDGVLLQNRTMFGARSGFAIASPELRLGDGERRVKITIDITSSSFTKVFGTTPGSTFKDFLDYNESSIAEDVIYGNGFLSLTPHQKMGKLLSNWLLFKFTGTRGWVLPDNSALGVNELPVTIAPNQMIVTLTLNRESDPVTSYASKVHGYNYNTDWPILEVLCYQTPKVSGVGIPKMAYEFLRDVQLTGYKIECEVTGMVNLKIGNDAGGLDAGKPYHPFTTHPKVGSNFYIGSREVFSKKLNYLKIELDWKGVPDEKLSNYYKAYKKDSFGPPPEDEADYVLDKNAVQRIVMDNRHFTAQLQILDDFGWRDLVKQATDDYLHESSSLALKQAREVMVWPLFLLMSVWTAYQRVFRKAGKPTEIGNNMMGAYTGQPVDHSNGIYHINIEESKELGRADLPSMPIQRNLKTKNWVYLFNYAQQDGDANDARLPHTITVQENSVAKFSWLEQPGSTYSRDPYLAELTEYKEGVKRGYVKLELINDFFHDAYGRILMERAKEIWSPVGAPNKPYTPELQKTTLDYKSSHTVTYIGANKVTWNTRVEQFFQVSPFGEVEVLPSQAEKILKNDSADIYLSNSLMPKLAKDANPITFTGRSESKVDLDTGRTVMINLEETSEGKLYIGIEDFNPPQGLSILFQFKEGTEVSDLEIPAVEWSYMSKNQWVSFESTEIVDDATNGLSNSGIIKFSIPADATDNNVVMESGYHWLRASISGNTEAFSDLISVHANAVKATYNENGNDPYRLNTEIEAEAISKLVNKDFEIKTIQQPYTSFGGRIEEQKSEYYARVAERLRHKQRGITIRDYEHLVLEEFPEIYKTKCINHTSKNSEYAPGSVSVIVIPYFKNQNERNPFELKVSKAKLSKIKRYLTKLNSPFVNLDVRNPKYESIQVEFGVEFKIGYDRTYYENQLNQEIREFISPWAFGKDEEISFGAKLNRSTILNFIEEREYVDYVVKFIMLHKEDENKAPVEVFIAEGTTASSVLVTALEHKIKPVELPC